MRNTLTILSLISALGGCATAYQPQGLSGGFSDTRLAENVFRVSFNGNGYTSRERAEEMTLLRSAEIAMRNGFTHFQVVDGNSRTDLSSFTTPSQATTYGTVNTYGNSANFNARTTYTGGQTFVVSRPSTTNTIVCFAGKPDVPGLVYEAKYIFDSLAPKYDVKR